MALNQVVKMSEIDVSKMTSEQVILATENLSHGVVMEKSVAVFNSADLKNSISQDNFNNTDPIVVKHLGNTPDETPQTDDVYKTVLELIVQYMVWRAGQDEESIKDGETEFKKHEKWVTKYIETIPSTMIMDLQAVATSLELPNLIHHVMKKISNDLKHLEKDINYSKIPENVLAEAIKYFGMDRYPTSTGEEGAASMDLDSLGPSKSKAISSGSAPSGSSPSGSEPSS